MTGSAGRAAGTACAADPGVIGSPEAAGATDWQEGAGATAAPAGATGQGVARKAGHREKEKMALGSRGLGAPTPVARWS